MPRAVGVFMLLFFALHGSAKAENSEDIIAGSDVALTVSTANERSPILETVIASSLDRSSLYPG